MSVDDTPRKLHPIKRVILGAISRAGYELRKKAPTPRRFEPAAHNDGAASHSVDTARRHLAAALAAEPPWLLDLGSTWAPQRNAMRRRIDTFTDPIEVLHHAQGQIAFDHRQAAGDCRCSMAVYDELVKREFPWFAQELDHLYDNPASITASLATLGGRPVSNVLFYHARLLLACQTYLPGTQCVLEIGGGYGALARLWLLNTISPASSYVLVDIPESLFFAEVALRLEFGDDAVDYFDGTHDPGTRILLVPIQHLRSLGRSCDLVLNSGSMQEMTDDWVSFYMDWLDTSPARHFYSFNYAAQPMSFLGESRNHWSPRPSARWATRRLALNTPLMSVDSPRDFLEAIYEKAPATGSLADWSVYRGMAMTRETYIEGLDLLRQRLTVDDATAFLEAARALPYTPKELLWIADWLREQGSDAAEGISADLRAIPSGHIAPVVP